MAWLPSGYEVDGKYAVIRPIAEGGMGQVYEAEDRHLGRHVALKVLPERHQDDAAARERLLREGRLVAKLQHPNIVRVYEVGSDGALEYVAMELLEGEDLHTRIQRLGPLPDEQIEWVAGALTDALLAMHAVGIVHRDLKPRNLFLANDGVGSTLKVLDFGVAKSMGSHEASLTGSGQLIGTLHYMAPEQVRGARYADARSDIWSLGAILYECASGRRPFEADSAPELLLKIASEDVAPLRALRPGLPARLVSVIERALQRDPARHPQSAAELRTRLGPSPSPVLPRIDGSTAFAPPRLVEPHGDSRTEPLGAQRTRAAALGLAAMVSSTLLVHYAFLREAAGAPQVPAAVVRDNGAQAAVWTRPNLFNLEEDAGVAAQRREDAASEPVRPSAPIRRRKRVPATTTASAKPVTPLPTVAGAPRDTSPAGAILLPEFFE